MRMILQPAFVLHHRPYRETSVLLDLFTQEQGRIALVAKGVRNQRSPLRALLQLFTPLLVSWQGKGELMTLSSAEPNGLPMQLRGDCLLSGFYLNELLTRLLHKHDPHPALYTIYQHTLIELQGGVLQQKTLRVFEKKLLAELGYGLQIEKVIAEKYYHFCPEQGLTECLENATPLTRIFSGKHLLAIAAEQLESEELLRDAKRLMRLALGGLLGPKPLQCRSLFITAEKQEIEIGIES